MVRAALNFATLAIMLWETHAKSANILAKIVLDRLLTAYLVIPDINC